MTFLPIVERELRAAARKRSTYRARLAVVLLTSATAALLLLISNPGSAKQMGGTIFTVLTTMAFIYCLAAGVRHGADCVSEEKREGTLGLLFLTDLRSYDIVLGKLAAVSVRSFQGLCAFLPVLAVALVLGGITVGEFWRAAAVLLNALFFALAVSLAVSSSVRQAHVALALSVVAVTGLTFGPVGADTLIGRFWPGWGGLIAFLSPAAGMDAATDLAYQANRWFFWRSLLLNHALGWCLLLLASVVVPRTWQDRPVRPAGLLFPTAGPPLPARARRARLDLLRQQLLNINPIYWLAARQEGHRWLLWGFVGLVCAAGAGAVFLSYWFGPGTLAVASVLGWVLQLVLKFWIGWAACATLAEARRTGAVELLLATPLQTSEVIRGHWLALRRFFLWPAIAALVLFVLPMAGQFWQAGKSSNEISALVALTPVAAMTVFGIITFLLDLLAIAWVGMWMGLSQPRVVQAFAKTILFAVVLPALVFCLPNLLFDLFWINWARRKLEHEFRSAALEQTAPHALLPPAGRSVRPVSVPPVIPPQVPPQPVPPRF